MTVDMVKLRAKTKPFDAAKYLKTDENRFDFLLDAFETGDTAYVSHAFGIIAKSVGMANVAKEVGLNRQNLYRALDENGNPSFKTISDVAGKLGYRLTLKKTHKEAA